MEAAFDGLVNVELHEFSADSVTQYLLHDTPAHFDVLSGCLRKGPPEPRSKSIVAAVTSRVAVFSIPVCVVGVPLPDKFWRWVQRGRFTVKILANKRWPGKLTQGQLQKWKNLSWNPPAYVQMCLRPS